MDNTLHLPHSRLEMMTVRCDGHEHRVHCGANFSAENSARSADEEIGSFQYSEEYTSVQQAT
jgi:hypothetical protein